MRDYKPTATWKREDNRLAWAAIALTWCLLCVDALQKI